MEYDSSEMRLLVAICLQLQREHGSEPFYLSCRTAGKLIGVDHLRANRWLNVLIEDNVLSLVQKGRPGKAQGLASRYRYVGEGIGNGPSEDHIKSQSDG